MRRVVIESPHSRDIKLRFMGVGEPEVFRCRIYEQTQRADLVDLDHVMREACSDGLVECPAYDAAIAAAVEFGWLNPKPTMRPVEGGRVAVWFATDLGRERFK